jgi:hypothetical protein
VFPELLPLPLLLVLPPLLLLPEMTVGSYGVAKFIYKKYLLFAQYLNTLIHLLQLFMTIFQELFLHQQVE